MTLQEPNKDRFLKALDLEEADRVTCFEYQIGKRSIRHVLGVGIPMQNMDPRDQVNFLNRTCVADSLVPDLSWVWYPKFKHLRTMSARPREDQLSPNYEKMISMSWEVGWADLQEMEEYRDCLDDLVEVAAYRVRSMLRQVRDMNKNTRIGIGPKVRSFMESTSLTLGVENFLKKLFTDRPLIEHVMDIYTDYCAKIMGATSELPIDFFVIKDSLNYDSNPFVFSNMVEELWMPRMEKMIKPLRSKGIPTVLNCDGDLNHVIPLAIELGIKGIMPIQPASNDICKYKKEWGDKICLMGNIDTMGLLTAGTPKDVADDVKEHIDRLAEPPGYIVTSSHPISDNVPPENFYAMIDAVSKYGRY